MREIAVKRVHPELKALVREASRALTLLDADRLEELALSCQALNRDLAPRIVEGDADVVRQAREAQSDMAVFARVLEATRANLSVMNRLREMRRDRLEYSDPQALGLGQMGGGYGNH